jgi:hypothetical protein
VTLAAVRCAERSARAYAKVIRSFGGIPEPMEAVDVTDRFFRLLETRGLLPDSLHKRARYFASFLVLIEEAMMNAEEKEL